MPERMRPGYPPNGAPSAFALLVDDLADRAAEIDALVGEARAVLGRRFALSRHGEPLTFGEWAVLQQIVGYRCVATTPAQGGSLTTVWLGTTPHPHDGPYETAFVPAVSGVIEVLATWRDEQQAVAGHRELVRRRRAKPSNSPSAAASHRPPGLPDIDADDLTSATQQNRARLWRARNELYAAGLSRDEAAERLGVKPERITQLLADTKLLGLEGRDGLRLPAWQFEPNARRGRLDGIDRVAAVFPGRTLGLSAWMVAPNPSLDGRTPAAALLDGDVEIVVTVAARHGA